MDAPPAPPSHDALAPPTNASTYEGAKSIAAAHIKAGSFAEAAEAYSVALELAAGAVQRAVILANRSLAHLSSGAPEEALRDAVGAVEASPRYAKAHYRLSKALLATAGSGSNSAGNEVAAVEALARSKSLAKSVVGSAGKPGLSSPFSASSATFALNSGAC